jgi:hypothetical protein
MAAGPIRKKTAAAIHQDIAREVNQLLVRIFCQRRNGGGTDLEAVEGGQFHHCTPVLPPQRPL